MTVDIGLIFAVLAAICFAAGMVFIRKGLFHSETPLGAVFIAVPIGVLFFSGLLIVTGQYETLQQISWRAVGILATSGVINFVAARLLNFTSLQHLGANRNSAIHKTTSIYAVIFGVVFLNESLSVLIIVGVSLVVVGATLASQRREEQPRSLHTKGIITGLAAAVLYATAAILIKLAVREAGSPIIAAFVSFVAAAVVLAGLLFRKQFRSQLVQLQSSSLVPFIIGGTLIAIAQLLRYTALDYSPVSLVQPLMNSDVLFILLLSFFINRKIEIFSARVILGIISTVVGGVLLFL